MPEDAGIPLTPQQEIREIIRQHDGGEITTIGDDVYEALTFAPEVVRFTSKQFRFLHHYRAEVPLEEAAKKAGLSPQGARAFLARESVKKWLADMAAKDHIRQKWEQPSEWWAKGEQMMHMENVPPHAVKIWTEFGDRVAPKQSRNAEQSGAPRIEIHISDPNAVQAAMIRQSAIDTQISKELGQ